MNILNIKVIALCFVSLLPRTSESCNHRKSFMQIAFPQLSEQKNWQGKLQVFERK